MEAAARRPTDLPVLGDEQPVEKQPADHQDERRQ